jgi:multidrug efflux pump subunit AcrB
MEKLLWEIPGVEYIYSTSRTGESQLIVRFLVGEDVERSLVRLAEKLRSNYDRIPPGVGTPLIKPKSIDDVPILTLTFHSQSYDHLTLRRLVAQVDDTVKQGFRSQKPPLSVGLDGNCACCSTRQGSPRAILLRRGSFPC